MHWRACFLKAKPRTETGPRREKRKIRDLSLERAVSRKIGMHGVVGDRMVGSWSAMNQGSRTEKGTAFMACRRSEELYSGGDRAFVVAKKRGNARVAKGGRKVETLNKRRKEADTVNVLWTQFGEEQPQLQTFRWGKVSVGRLGNESQPRIEPERSMAAPVDLLWS
jgi:hypothetical protein